MRTVRKLICCSVACAALSTLPKAAYSQISESQTSEAQTSESQTSKARRSDDFSAIPKVEAPLPPVEIVPEAKSPVGRQKAIWASFAGGAAAAAAGATFFLSAKSRQDDMENLVRFTDFNGVPLTYEGTARSRYRKLAREGRALNGVAIASFSIAGALAVTGVVLLLTKPRATKAEEYSERKPRRPRGSVAISPSIGPDGPGVTALWKF